jgi:hypothetical protein
MVKMKGIHTLPRIVVGFMTPVGVVDSYCVNCQVKGHPVWDRKCPFFIDRCKRICAAHKDGDYRFFVTHNTSSWETFSAEPLPPISHEQSPLSQPTLGPQRAGTSGRGGRGRGSYNTQRASAPPEVDIQLAMSIKTSKTQGLRHRGPAPIIPR